MDLSQSSCIKFLEVVAHSFHGEVMAVKTELKLPVFVSSPDSVGFLFLLLKCVNCV